MLERIDRWIFEAYPARVADLAVVRVLYAAFMLLTQLPRALWTTRAPAAFYAPPFGPVALLTDWPPPWVIYGLNGLLLASLVLLLVGWRTPIASLVAGLSFIALGCWQFASVKIDHDILLGVTPLALAASGWGARWSVDALRAGRPAAATDPARAWCLALLALLIGAAMFTAGWGKAATGWLDPATHSTFAHLTSFYVRDAVGILGEPVLRIGAPWFRESADWAATLLELAVLPAVFWRPTFRAALAVLAAFHLANVLLFGIVFSANVVAYAAFVPWSRILPRRAWAGSASQGGLAAIGLAGLAAGLFALFLGPIVPIGPIHLGLVILGAAVAAGYLAWLARRSVAPSPRRPPPEAIEAH